MRMLHFFSYAAFLFAIVYYITYIPDSQRINLALVLDKLDLTSFDNSTSSIHEDGKFTLDQYGLINRSSSPQKGTISASNEIHNFEISIISATTNRANICLSNTSLNASYSLRNAYEITYNDKGLFNASEIENDKCKKEFATNQ